MTSNELRQRFLKFFEKKGHAVVPPSSLLPTDPSVLFTTAGMQQFKPYFLGEASPYGKKAASCQKCFRTSDIEEVGDERHLTFFEMLGNFSFGDYGKETAIKLAKDFLHSVNLKIDYVTVFKGDESVSKDEESALAWNKLGFSEEKGSLKFFGREDNFWGPTGQEGPCGPTTEIYINGVEIWNLVFNEYFHNKNKELAPLKQSGVDTGMGLERLAMVSQGKSNVFETDLFEPIIKKIPGNDERTKRIISDHVKASCFLVADGVLPLNVERGYVLRRIIRRLLSSLDALNLPFSLMFELINQAVQIYQETYLEIKSGESNISAVLQKEIEKFERARGAGEREFEKVKSALSGKLSGEDAFRLYSTYGFSLEEMRKKGGEIDENGFWSAFKNHQEVSRAGVGSKFGGGGEFSPKLHTATHLLHAALRDVLGKHVQQMGSDINAQRLRFDFSHHQKMTEEEIEKAEDLINSKIKEDLEVKMEEMTYEKALESGALAFFKEKYPERVTVYSVGDPAAGSGQAFSREICAGPHVKRTGELGRFKIIKEESSGAGVRRLRAILE